MIHLCTFLDTRAEKKILKSENIFGLWNRMATPSWIVILNFDLKYKFHIQVNFIHFIVMQQQWQSLFVIFRKPNKVYSQTMKLHKIQIQHLRDTEADLLKNSKICQKNKKIIDAKTIPESVIY